MWIYGFILLPHVKFTTIVFFLFAFFVFMPTTPIISLDSLKHVSPQQQRALEELQRMFYLNQDTLFSVVDLFRNELKNGLIDDVSCDLNMIPTFVTGCSQH